MTDVLEHYRFLHAIPEPGFKEYKTAAYVAKTLKGIGYEVQDNVAGSTGIVAVYDSGNPGPSLGLRADMDALPHIIDGKREYRHTCGHDAHVAMLLSAAEEIKKKKLVKKGRLKFIFQPAEELGQGALKMLEGGAVNDIDILIGMHIRPKQECPAGSIICSMLYSATCIFKVKLQGVPSHGARPHLGINPIDAAVAAIVAVNSIHMDPRIPFSVKCTQLHADGGAFNAIPGFAELSFDLRSQNNGTMKEMKEKTLTAIEHGVASVGAKVAGYEYCSVLPAADGLDKEVAELIAQCACEIVGSNNVIPAFQTSGGEDFFHYTVNRPHIKAGFIGLGVGAEPILHHPDMHFDVSKLKNGVEMETKLVQKILGYVPPKSAR